MGAGAGAALFGGGPVVGRAVAKIGGKLTDHFSGVGQFAPSQFGPYQSGYQFPQQPSQPSVSGLPGNDMGYATLPNYGQAPQGGNLGFSSQPNPSPFGPYASGYQVQGGGPTVSGLPNTPTSYGVSLPNYGGPAAAPGGFANGIFAGGRGNFGPSGGPVAGAGGPRGSINYANQDAMNASIAATQQAMLDSRNGPSNARQAGGNIRGNSYGF